MAMNEKDFIIKNGVIIEYSPEGYDEFMSKPTRIGLFPADDRFVIPEFIGSEKVVAIGNKVFKNFDFKELVIPSGVQYIGDAAFFGCAKLKRVTMPTALTGIGERVFGYCVALTEINIPDGVFTIGRAAFMNCKSLKNVNIPSTLETIEGSAFMNCKLLKSVTLPSHTDYTDDAFPPRTKIKKIDVASPSRRSSNKTIKI